MASEQSTQISRLSSLPETRSQLPAPAPSSMNSAPLVQDIIREIQEQELEENNQVSDTSLPNTQVNYQVDPSVQPRPPTQFKENRGNMQENIEDNMFPLPTYSTQTKNSLNVQKLLEELKDPLCVGGIIFLLNLPYVSSFLENSVSKFDNDSGFLRKILLSVLAVVLFYGYKKCL